MSRNVLFMYTFSFFVMRMFRKLHSGVVRRTVLKMIEKPIYIIYCETLEMFEPQFSQPHFHLSALGDNEST